MKKNELEEMLESLGWTVEVVHYGAKYWATGMRASIRIGGSVIYLFAGERPAVNPLGTRSRQEILHDAENDVLYTVKCKRLIEKDAKTGCTKSVPGIACEFNSVAELGIQLAAIGYWQKMLEDMERGFTPNEVHVITDKGVLNPIRNEIFQIVQDSYADIGGFHGASSPRTLIKDTDLAKIVFGEDGKVTALALYRTDLDGNKRFCSGTRKSDPAYREAAEMIVKSDIEPYDGWYWVEASGAIEKLFKKNGGNPIPNHVAVRQIGVKGKDASLMNDGVHYETYYGQDRTPEIKMMFGFKNQDVYDRVMSEIDDYGKFKAFALSLAEGDAEKSVAAERAFISDLFDMHREGVVNELTPKWRDRLESAKSVIENYMARGDLSAAETASLRGSMSRAETCLEEMPVLKLGKIVA